MSSPNLAIAHTGLPQLATALAAAGSGVAAEVEPVVRTQGRELRDTARTMARLSARKHGKLYPSSITDDVFMMDGAIGVEVGPDISRQQGGMSFELGSANQAPHNDIGLAGALAEPLFAQAVEDAVDALLTAHGL